MPVQLLSEERIEDSSDGESDNTNSTPTLKETVKKIRSNSSSRPAVNTDSDEDSDESDAESQASDGSSTSSTSSAGKRKADDMVTTSTESTAKRTKTAGTTSKRIESAIYVPPSGFVQSRFAAHEFSAQTKGMFDALEGKQIWHISAPSSMPMSTLKSLNVESALKGTPILSNDRTQYILQQNALEGQNLLLPKGTAGEYTASTFLPSRSFRIFETVQKSENDRIDAENDNDEVSKLQFFATKSGEQKPPRTQPQNLHGRYVPYGVVSNEQVPDEDTAMSTTADSEQTGNTAPRTPKKSKKNRAENTEKGNSVSGSKKKSKSKVAESSPIVTDSHKKKRKDKTVSSSE